MSDNHEVSCTVTRTAEDTSSRVATTTTEEQTMRAAHEAVLSTYPEEAQKAYPEGWSEEDKTDFNEWVNQHAKSLDKERPPDSQSEETADEVPSDSQNPRPDPTEGRAEDELPQCATPPPRHSESTRLSGRDLRDEGAGQQTQFAWTSTLPSERTRSSQLPNAHAALVSIQKQQTFTSRDFDKLGVQGLVQFVKDCTAWGESSGDSFYFLERYVEPGLWPLLVSLYNSYGIIANPNTPKVKKVDYITLQMWKSFLAFRALKEAEAVGGDHANQLATLVIKTVNELASNAKNAAFVELVIKFMPKITPLMTAIKDNMNFEAMGSFRL